MKGVNERVGTERVGTASLLERPEVKQQIERVRAQIEGLDAQVRRTVQDQPLVAVATALLFGYAVGRLLARR